MKGEVAMVFQNYALCTHRRVGEAAGLYARLRERSKVRCTLSRRARRLELVARSPQLFFRPESIFVAGFIVSPEMNPLSAQAATRWAALSDSWFKLLNPAPEGTSGAQPGTDTLNSSTSKVMFIAVPSESRARPAQSFRRPATERGDQIARRARHCLSHPFHPETGVRR